MNESAIFRFTFGVMGAGKSTLALQLFHNKTNIGAKGDLLVCNPRTRNTVSSRIGASCQAKGVDQDFGFRNEYRDVPLEFLVIDEAHFLEQNQINHLIEMVDTRAIDVFCFGLKTDYLGRMFEGTKALIESVTEIVPMSGIKFCWCGEQATHNALIENNIQRVIGDQVCVDNDPSIEYKSLCRKHWMAQRHCSLLS